MENKKWIFNGRESPAVDPPTFKGSVLRANFEEETLPDYRTTDEDYFSPPPYDTPIQDKNGYDFPPPPPEEDMDPGQIEYFGGGTDEDPMLEIEGPDPPFHEPECEIPNFEDPDVGEEEDLYWGTNLGLPEIEFHEKTLYLTGPSNLENELRNFNAPQGPAAPSGPPSLYSRASSPATPAIMPPLNP
jgi:hypothetical protein